MEFHELINSNNKHYQEIGRVATAIKKKAKLQQRIISFESKVGKVGFFTMAWPITEHRIKC